MFGALCCRHTSFGGHRASGGVSVGVTASVKMCSADTTLVLTICAHEFATCCCTLCLSLFFPTHPPNRRSNIHPLNMYIHPLVSAIVNLIAKKFCLGF